MIGWRGRRIGWQRIVISVVALVMLALIFRVWRHTVPPNDGTFERVEKSGLLMVGMDASYPPFSNTPSGGDPAGLDVDIANEIGKRLNVKVHVVNMGFDGLYDALFTGQVDALLSALSIAPGQLGRVSYTRGYIDAGTVIVSPDGHYQHMPDLDGKTVAVEYGSEGDETARLWQRRLHSLTIAHFGTADEALNAAAQGKADAALLDSVTARLYLRAHKDAKLSISPDLVTSDIYAIAVRQTSLDLEDAISKALDDMQADGTLDAIINRWL